MSRRLPFALALALLSLAIHGWAAPRRDHRQARLQELVRSAQLIVVAKKLEPLVVDKSPTDPRPNRLARHAVAYRVWFERVLKNALPSTISAGVHEVEDTAEGAPYRTQRLEAGGGERVILFLNAYRLAAPNAWEDAGKEAEVARLVAGVH